MFSPKSERAQSCWVLHSVQVGDAAADAAAAASLRLSRASSAEPPSEGDSSVSSGSLEGQSKGMLIYFQDVAYSVPVPGQSERKTIIEGITGHFEPGQMTAVMGPSGSGKTTLLDVLAGRKTAGALSGTVLFGGLPPSRALLRRAAGYVEQFDTLVDSLSCAEMLLYTAQLKRPRQEPLASKQAAVDSLLARLGLSGCAGSQIGGALKRGISGGQAKRLNIGIALITDPRVLFLDEPTSGLDSATANEVMTVVAGLTRDGTTVATTIHSPSSYTYGLFDKLLVLLGGRAVYLGGAGDAAIGYFTLHCGARQPRVGDNLAEWMLESVTQADRSSAKGSLADTYHKSLQAKANASAYAAHAEAQYRHRARSVTMQELQQLSSAGDALGPGWAGGQAADGCSCSSLMGCHAYVTPAWWSLKVLLQYRTLRNYRSAGYVLPRVLEKLLFAAVVLSLYWGKGVDFSTMNVPVLSSLMFLMVLAPICASMMFLPSMGLEKALFIRERNDGLYRPITYLIFKLLDELAMMAPVTAATSAAVFYACSLQGSFLLFWLVSYATLANGTALAYFLASVCPSLMVGMPVLSFTLILLLVLCGFMVRLAAVPCYWAWAVKANVVHYSWGALMINQYSAGGPGRSQLGGVGVLSYFGFAGADAWAYLGVVALFFCGWSVLAWAALAYTRHHKR